MSVIDEIVSLLARNPNITAKEIAQALGYAEEKSIYYWLRKAGYGGLRQFRAAVLRRAEPILDGAPSIARDSVDPRVPVYADEDLSSSTQGLWDYLVQRLNPGCFGVAVSKGHLVPVAARGDLLIVDPSAPHFQGDLLLVRQRGTLNVVRQYTTPENNHVFVDARRPGVVVVPDSIEGKITMIVKAQ